jgi:hypothetical protein
MTITISPLYLRLMYIGIMWRGMYGDYFWIFN